MAGAASWERFNSNFYNKFNLKMAPSWSVVFLNSNYINHLTDRKFRFSLNNSMI